MSTIYAGLVKLAAGLRFLAQIALASMVLTICYDVVMRYVFKAPTEWGLEVNTFLVVFITLFPAADVMASDSHLRITFFEERLGAGARRFTRPLTCVLGVLYCGVMTWKGLQMTLLAFRYDERMSTPLGTPLGIPYSFIPIGFAALGLLYLVSLFTGSQTTAPPRQQEV